MSEDEPHASQAVEFEDYPEQTFRGRVVTHPVMAISDNHGAVTRFKFEYEEDGQTIKREVGAYGVDLARHACSVTAIGQEVTIIGRYYIRVRQKPGGKKHFHKIIKAAEIRT